MPKNTSTDESKKLLVQFRLEPGCLGPEGDKYIEDFCQFAQTELRNFNKDFAQFEITPRYDKTLPEIQYNIDGKNIKHSYAAKYFQRLKKDISEFEESVDDKLTLLIEQCSAG